MMNLRPFAALTILAFPLLAAAQEPAPEAEQDPPGRVARLSYISGDVTFQSGTGDAIEAASLNLPVTTGDRLMTGTAARSELTFGVAAVRLDSHTDLSVANLDEELAQLELNSGTIAVHVRELENNQTVQIDAPNATVQLLEPGDYRVEVDSRGDVYVDVRSGQAEIDPGNTPTSIREGEQAYLAAGSSNPDIRSLGREDDFDLWAANREEQLNGREATRYVSREVVGYEDLDGYGDWRTVADYGPVWYPRVAVGWAPYRYGRWVWVSPWGWTWIDRSPWGFAPFHYGRWAYVSSRWCWVPGPRHYRPVYAPALVSWVGDPYGSSISISIGTGPIGWFPLGPREVYVPHRHVSPRYLRRVNVSNTVIVNNTYITNVARNRVNNIRYVNRDAPGAITRAPRHDFDSRRPGPDRQWTVRRGNDDRGRPGFSRSDNRSDGNRGVHLARDRNSGNTVRQLNVGGASERRDNPAVDRSRDRSDNRGNNERRDFTPRNRDGNSTVTRPTRTPDRDRAGSSNNRPGVVQRSTESPRPPPQFERDFNRPREKRDDNARRERRPDVQRPAPTARQNDHMYRVPDRSSQQAPRAERREAPPARPREQTSTSRPPQQEQRAERRHGGAVQQGSSSSRGNSQNDGKNRRSGGARQRGQTNR